MASAANPAPHAGASPLLTHILAGARHGGAETYFVTLLQALARSGLAQSALIRPHEEREAALAAAGIPYATVPLRGRLDLVTPLRVRQHLGRLRPRLVLAWMTRAARATPRGPWVRAARLGGYYPAKAYRGFDRLVVNTPGLADHLTEGGIAPERITLIPNMVRAVQAPPLPRTSFNTPDGATILLGVGRLHPEKAWEVAIQALTRLPRAVLWLAGEGPDRARLETLAREAFVGHQLRFLGWQEDVAPLLATADIFVFPSRQEPFGNAIVEAWAAGCPVVAAASPGGRWLLRDGSDGRLVPPDEPVALAAALEDLAGSPAARAAFADAGRLRAQAFSEAAIVQLWAGWLQRVLEPSGLHPPGPG